MRNHFSKINKDYLVDSKEDFKLREGGVNTHSYNTGYNEGEEVIIEKGEHDLNTSPEFKNKHQR